MRSGIWLLSAFAIALVAPIGLMPLAPDHSANSALERYQGKLAELTIVRDTGDSQDLRQAITWLQEHARVLQRLNLSEAAARGYLLTGEIYEVLSQYQRATASYRRALHLSSKGSYLGCTAMSHLARVYATTGDWQRAFNLSRNARDSSGGLHCWAEALQSEAEASRFSNQQGDLGHSFDLALIAADVFAYEGDAGEEAQALLTAAYSEFQLNQAEDGFRLAEQALRIWSSTGNRHGMALAHTALGFFSIRRSNPEYSLSESKQALQIFAPMGDRDNEAIVYSNLGLLAKEIGNLDEAYENFKHASLLFAAAHDLIGEVSAVDSQADIMWRERNYVEANRLYQAELMLSRRAHNAPLEAAAYLGLGSILDANGKDRQALSYCQLALALEQAAHDDYGIGESWRYLGRLYAKHKQEKDALAAFQHALEFKIRAEASSEEAAVHHEIGSVYHHLHQLESARNEIEKAIHLIESERTKVSGFDDRASYFASVHQYYELYVEVLMELHEQHPQQGFAQQAFEAWEQSKMRSLLDMLAGRSQNADCSAEYSATIIPACGGARALTLSEIQQEIHGDDSLIVEYALGKNAGYVWVLSDQNLWSYKVPNATGIQPLVERFRRDLRARLNVSADQQSTRLADGDFRAVCQALTQVLLAPIADRLLGKRIILVADGPLQHVPFSVLPFPSADGQETLLRDHNELVYLPSASALKFIRDRAKVRPLPSRQAAVYANPVFSREDLHWSSIRAAGKTRGAKPEYPLVLKWVLRDMHLDDVLPRLPGTEEEAKALVEIMGQDQVFVATGTKATREAVLKGDLGNYRHILFATHSLLDEKHPELSGLVFSLVNEAGKKLDGFLRVKDIYQLKLSAEMVVLSACESALGRDLQSEGMIGLTRAFLYAGSKRVVSSLWKVDDGATAELIRHFYQYVHDGKDPGEALRLAQKDLSQNRQWRHPYFWAGFILQGDYRPIDSQH
ncbi:MAG TPA: CHAT domain-containing tetratricopeptide repeat protein [Candidatus Angelobacter sp.]|nr:CHAT domain-containing tetratricopeptide repeat protein [Candidatus Angelobacter sp.]